MKNDKCRCECKGSIDEGICDKEYIWNPSNCKCECDKSCDFSEHLDYENCRKRLIDKLIEECNENIEDTSLINSTKCENNSCIYYTLCYFQYSLQSMLELLLILFITNT